jgi:hypothetical protein
MITAFVQVRAEFLLKLLNFPSLCSELWEFYKFSFDISQIFQSLFRSYLSSIWIAVHFLKYLIYFCLTIFTGGASRNLIGSLYTCKLNLGSPAPRKIPSSASIPLGYPAASWTLSFFPEIGRDTGMGNEKTTLAAPQSCPPECQEIRV